MMCLDVSEVGVLREAIEYSKPEFKKDASLETQIWNSSIFDRRRKN